MQVELADFTGRKEGIKLYVLDPSVAAKMKEDATATAQHATTSAELESLPIGNGKPLQVGALNGVLPAQLHQSPFCPLQFHQCDEPGFKTYDKTC